MIKYPILEIGATTGITAPSSGVPTELHGSLQTRINYTIPENKFVWIVAVSALEHVESEAVLDSVIRQMALGTKEDGINCIIVNSEVAKSQGGVKMKKASNCHAIQCSFLLFIHTTSCNKRFS